MSPVNLQSRIQGPVAVIGDIHGQVDKLSIVIDRLRHLPDFQQRWIVFIGDLVDRGPDPKGAIDLIFELIDEHSRTTAIMGNHEFAMCGALGWIPEAEGKFWSQRWVDFYNSQSTFESYDAVVGDLEDLAAKVPDAHREFLINLPWCVEHPRLLFVHAGLDPNLPFDLQLNILKQRDFTLTRPSWLCEKPFVAIDPPPDCPFTVVSGHVKVDSVVIRPRRILVDTTGGDSGELSCVLMPERLVISSDEHEPEPYQPEIQESVKTGSSPSKWWNIWG